MGLDTVPGAPAAAAGGSGVPVVAPGPSTVPADGSGSVGTQAVQATTQDFLHLLCQSVPPGAVDTPNIAPIDKASCAKPADESGSAESRDPAAIALALGSQALVAVSTCAVTFPAASTAQTAPPANAGTVSAAAAGFVPAACATAANGAAPASDALTQALLSMGGTSAQDLASLLSHDVAVDTKSTSGFDPARVDASAAAPKVDGTGNSATPLTAAHIGLASHLALQHPPSDTGCPTFSLRSPVGTPAWTDELTGRITWMANEAIQFASLRLSPERLGPLEVRISVQNGDASVWFGAAQADTRAALEQALPRLRELFAAQGLALVNAGVSDEAPRGHPNTAAVPAAAPVYATSSDELSAASVTRVRLGLVDTYA
jgi:flagellar hook-length control protein FliK